MMDFEKWQHLKEDVELAVKKGFDCGYMDETETAKGGML